jgi:polyhydroxybutyrate depolymerase
MHMRRTAFRGAHVSLPAAALVALLIGGGLACQPQAGSDGASAPDRSTGGAPGATGGQGTGTGGSSAASGGATGGSSASSGGSGPSGGEFPGTGGSGSGSATGGAAGATDAGGTGASGGAGGSTSPADGGAPADPDPSTPAASSSEACGKGIAAPMEGLHDMMVDGMARKFFLRIPAAYDGKKAWPVVFAFHGAGDKTASWFDTNTGFRAENEDKAVMLFPESLTSGGSHTWMTASQHPANLAFVDAMIDWTKKNICVDPSRIFATGQSSGAYFGQTMACQRGDVFRAVATNSGGERYFENCKGNPGVMLSYGKGDDASHINAAMMATKFWIERNMCKPDGTMPIDPAPCVQYSCKQGSPFVLCARPDGHPWPAFANKGFWKFFSQF